MMIFFSSTKGARRPRHTRSNSALECAVQNTLANFWRDFSVYWNVYCPPNQQLKQHTKFFQHVWNINLWLHASHKVIWQRWRRRRRHSRLLLLLLLLLQYMGKWMISRWSFIFGWLGKWTNFICKMSNLLKSQTYKDLNYLWLNLIYT